MKRISENKPGSFSAISYVYEDTNIVEEKPAEPLKDNEKGNKFILR